MNVIGLGSAGCNIADKLSSYPQYTIYKLDVGLKKAKGVFPLTKRSSTEQYEEKFSKKVFSDLKKIDGDALFIVGGGGSVSSASLRVLEALKENKVEVIYVRPDTSFMNEVGVMLDRAVFNVLQEYARSGMLDKLYIVSNSEIERVVGDLPVSKYHDKINEIIASTIHMVNVYRNSETPLSNIAEGTGVSRISTIGVGTMEKVIDQMFFSLDYTSEKVYYFAINKKQMEEDNQLLFSIKNRIKQDDSTIKTSFGVFTSPYEENYIYIVASTKIIQGVKYE